MKISWDKVFGIVTKYLPGLIALAEGLFSWKKKSGADKQAWVSDSLKTVVTAVAEESEGGQKNTWEESKEAVDMLIDGGVALANASGAFKEPSGIELYSPTSTD